jgi:hypothetical protein
MDNSFKGVILSVYQLNESIGRMAVPNKNMEAI